MTGNHGKEGTHVRGDRITHLTAARPAAPSPLRYVGVDENYLGRRDKFLTVVSDLESGDPLWAARDPKRETLDWFVAEALTASRRPPSGSLCRKPHQASPDYGLACRPPMAHILQRPGQDIR